MRHWNRFLFAALMAALFLLGSRALIRGPAAAPPQAQPAARIPVLCPLPVPADQQSPHPGVSFSERAERAAVLLCAFAALPLSEADRNGWVLTGRSWFRAVYTACPPEAAFG